MFVLGAPFFGEWRRIAGIMHDTVAARLLMARAPPGVPPWDAVIGLLERAAASQDAIPYMEPELWVPSLRVCLAEARLRAGDTATAAQLYVDEFHHRPHSAEAVAGLAAARGEAPGGAPRCAAVFAA